MDKQRTGIALVGLGMVSGTYAPALRDLSDSIDFRGVYDQMAEGVERYRTTHAALLPEGCRAYASAGEIAADPGVGIVIVATPPDARTELVRLFAGAGKHLLLEKPVERTPAAAEEIVRICEEAGVRIAIMLQHRARPSAVELAGRIAAGSFGPLHSVEVMIPWWRPQSYYDQPGRGTYARDGGGVLISQAIHTLDLTLGFAGPVDEVTALSATTGAHRMEAEDFVSAGLHFRNGAVGALFATTASYPGRTESITLNHEHVSARMEANLLTLNWQDGRTETVGQAGASGAGANPMDFTHEWHRTIVADFAAAISEERDPIAGGWSALGVHRLIAAIEESARTGRRVAVAG